MKMVDMELPKKSAKELKTEMAPSKEEGPRYPYGLELSFNSESMGKLPQLKGAKVGQKVIVQGVGEISRVSMHENKNGKEEWDISIQLQEVGCEPKKKEKSESMGDAMKRAEKYL